MNKKYVSILSSVCALGALSVTYTQCGKSAHLFGSSKQERSALQQPVFQFPDHGPDTGVEDGDDTDPTSDNGDSYIPSNPYKPEQDPFKWVTSCNELEAQANPLTKEAYIQKVSGDSGVLPTVPNSRDFELAVVKKIVEDRIKAIKAGEQLPLLIPVEFTFSTGDKHDKTSYMAYRRSILRNDHDGVSYLPTGKHTYVVEHDVARSHFIDGRFKYYSFVEVKKIVPNGEKSFVEFTKNQSLSAWDAFKMHEAASGLKHIQDYITHYDSKNELPVGRLFLADIRDKIVPNSTKVGSMYEDVSVSGRNSEVTRRLKDIFNMKNIFEHSNLLTHAYSVDRTIEVDKYKATYAGYAGMPQLIHKMNCDVGSTSVIAAQYTPIVLDLGAPYIRTSSEYWGTFFNLADARIVKGGEVLPAVGENTFSHRTAWVGGTLKKVPNPALTGLSPATTVVPNQEVWQRVAEDGFLVLPNEDKQMSATNLFGASFVNPENPLEKYEDGFLALQAYAGTRDACAQPMAQMSYTGEPTEEQLSQRYDEIKKRYFGPWNEKFFNLKVWVDENRDGVSQATELKNLVEAGVLALNTCLTSVSEIDETDKFGNNTKLRSAFLYKQGLVSGSKPSESEITEILRTLALGKNSSGEDGNFRLMVDIFFKARPFHFLERSLKHRSGSDAVISKDKSKKFQVKIGDQIYDEDDTSVPLLFD